jgi:ribosomal protein L11 methyltransferase
LAEYPALDIEIAPPAGDSLYDRLYALLDDYQPAAIDPAEDGGHWRVFFRSANQRDAAFAALGAIPQVRASAVEVPDEDWARRTQEGLRAIEAGRLIVAPPWDIPRGGKAVIIIEPSTGFGTGHHATTRLCLLLLQQLDLRRSRVLDVGTGSGVLALAAWKLGAHDVVAIDNDPDALANARENIARNGAAAAIDIIRDDVETLRIQRAEVVMANLTGAVLVRYAEELHSLVVKGGCLIVSGFAPDDSAVIGRAFSGMDVIAEKQEGDWAALTLRA